MINYNYFYIYNYGFFLNEQYEKFFINFLNEYILNIEINSIKYNNI